jgi:hypothetical protein
VRRHRAHSIAVALQGSFQRWRLPPRTTSQPRPRPTAQGLWVRGTRSGFVRPRSTDRFGRVAGSERVEVDVAWWVGRCGVGSGCLSVLVDESVAAGVSSDRSAGPIFDDVAIVGSALAQTAMGSTFVEMHDVRVEEPFELRAVPDEGAIEELAAHGADPAFRIRVRDLWVPNTRPAVVSRRFARGIELVAMSSDRHGVTRGVTNELIAAAANTAKRLIAESPRQALLGDETDSTTTVGSGGSRSSRERSLDDCGLHEVAGQRPGRIFGTHRAVEARSHWRHPHRGGGPIARSTSSGKSGVATAPSHEPQGRSPRPARALLRASNSTRRRLPTGCGAVVGGARKPQTS